MPNKTPDFLNPNNYSDINAPEKKVQGTDVASGYQTPTFMQDVLNKKSEATPGAETPSMDEWMKIHRDNNRSVLGKIIQTGWKLIDNKIEPEEIVKVLGPMSENMSTPKARADVMDYLDAGVRAWKMTDLTMQRNRIGNKMRDGMATPGDLVRLDALNMAINGYNQQVQKDPLVSRAFGQVGPFLYNSMVQGGKGAMVGSMIMGLAAVAGGQTPWTVGTAEEVATVPIAFGTGAAFGSMFYSVNDIAEVERGGAYLDLLEMGIKPEAAGWWSDLYATGAGAAEVVGFKLLRNLVPGGDQIAKNIFARAAREVLTKNARLKAVGRGVASLAGETGVEVGQQLWQNVIETAAAMTNDAFEGTDIAPETRAEFQKQLTKELWDTAKMTAVGMGVAAAPGVAFNVALAKNAPTQYAPKLERTGFSDVRQPEIDVVPAHEPAKPKPKTVEEAKVPEKPKEEPKVQEKPVEEEKLPPQIEEIIKKVEAPPIQTIIESKKTPAPARGVRVEEEVELTMPRLEDYAPNNQAEQLLVDSIVLGKEEPSPLAISLKSKEDPVGKAIDDMVDARNEEDLSSALKELGEKYGVPAQIADEKLKMSQLNQPAVLLTDGTTAAAPPIQKNIAFSKPEVRIDIENAFQSLRDRYGDAVQDQGFLVNGEFVNQEWVTMKLLSQSPKMLEKAKQKTADKGHKETMKKFRAAERSEAALQEKLANMRPPTRNDELAFDRLLPAIKRRVHKFRISALGRQFDADEMQQHAIEKTWLWLRGEEPTTVQAFLDGDKDATRKLLGMINSKDKSIVNFALMNYVKDKEGQRQGKSRAQISKELEDGTFRWTLPYLEDIEGGKSEVYVDTKYGPEVIDPTFLRRMQEDPRFEGRIRPEDLPKPEDPKFTHTRFTHASVDEQIGALREIMYSDLLNEEIKAVGFNIDKARRRLNWDDERITNQLLEEGYETEQIDDAFWWADKIQFGRDFAERTQQGSAKEKIRQLEEDFKRRQTQREAFGEGEGIKFDDVGLALPGKGQVKLKPVKKLRTLKIGGREVPAYGGVAYAREKEGEFYSASKEAAYQMARLGNASPRLAALVAARKTGRKLIKAGDGYFLVGKEPVELADDTSARKVIKEQRRALEAEIKAQQEAKRKAKQRSEEAKHAQEIEDTIKKLREVKQKIGEIAAQTPVKAAEPTPTRTTVTAEDLAAVKPVRAPRRTIVSPAQTKKLIAEHNKLAAKFRAAKAGKGTITTEEKKRLAHLRNRLKNVAKKKPAPKTEVTFAAPTVPKNVKMITLESIQRDMSRDKARIFLNEKGSAEMLNVVLEHMAVKSTKVLDWLQIEPRFKRLMAPLTGRAVKLVASKTDARMQWGISKAKQFQDLVEKSFGGKVTREELGMVVVAAEDPIYLLGLSKEMQDKVTKPAEWLRTFFENAQKELEKSGITVDFMKRKIMEVNEKLQEERAAKERDYEKIEWLEAKLEILNRMHFQHIPAKVWAWNELQTIDKKYKRNIERHKARAKLESAVAHTRKATSFSEMVTREKNPMPLENINPYDIILSYSKNLGRDLALRDIAKAATAEGLMKTGSKKPNKIAAAGVYGGWTKVPKRLMVLRDEKASTTWVSDQLLHALDDTMSSLKPQTKFEKAMAVIKMTKFYNFIFLPMYDVVQQNMAIPAAIFRPGMYKAWNDAVKMIATRDPEYIRALKHGLASKPFAMPLDEIISIAERFANQGTMGTAMSYMMPLVEQAFKVHKGSLLKPMYQASWFMAWKLDETVRMATYLYLKNSKGMSAVDAAQTAATFHGDYASIPAKTRRFLNKIFFTPTFKIAMGKLYYNIVKNFIKTYGGIKGTQSERRYAYGVLGILSVQLGTSIFAQYGLGLEEDEFGRRYYKKYRSRRGPKELVFTFSHPANMMFNYYNRFARIMDAAFGTGSENPAMTALENFKWDVHPLWRGAFEIAMNKDANGDPIVYEFGNWPMILARWLNHAAKTSLGIYEGVVQQTVAGSAERQEAKKKIIDDYGELNEFLLRLITFSYVRKQKRVRDAARITAKVRRFSQAQKRYAMDHRGTNKTWYKQFKRQLRTLMRELNE